MTVFLTKDLTLKRKSITVAADNSFYKLYDIPLGEIVEIWQHASEIFPEDFEPDNFENYNLRDSLYF